MPKKRGGPVHARMALSDLTPAEYNPRQISDEALAGLTASIHEFGLVQPIIWNKRTKRIVGGHQRVKALSNAGETEADVVVVSLTAAREKALNVALNNQAISGEFTDDLQSLLAEISADDGDLFSALLLDELLEPDPVEPIKQDEIPEPASNPVTRPGDVWTLGEHRLLCGDCRNSASVASLGRRFALAFTSPPYASQREYDSDSGFEKVPPREYGTWFEPVQAAIAESLEDDGSWFVNIKEHCEGGARDLYVKDLVLSHVREWGWLLIDELCWVRGGVPGRWPNRFKNAWEPVFHFARSPQVRLMHDNVLHESADVKTYSRNNPRTHTGFISGSAPSKHGMALPSNVLKVPSGPRQIADAETKHTATFPVGLPEFFIRAFSREGDHVLDPFMGSGTTLIAAEQLDRVCSGIEISPAYCDLIVERWQNLTGGQAKRL